MQRYRIVIMLMLFGVLPVVAAFFVALSFLGEQEVEPPSDEVRPAAEETPPPSKPPEKQEVLAAARALPVGTLLGKDDLTVLELDPATVGEEHVVLDETTTADSLRGHAVREALAEGAPLTWSAVVGPGQRGFLAAVLRPGTRAVTIRVGPATSYAGLIDPGDRVDVILSADLAGRRGGADCLRAHHRGGRASARDRPPRRKRRGLCGGRRRWTERACRDSDRNPGGLAGARASPGARRAGRQSLAGGPFSRRGCRQADGERARGGGPARDAAVLFGARHVGEKASSCAGR